MCLVLVKKDGGLEAGGTSSEQVQRKTFDNVPAEELTQATAKDKGRRQLTWGSGRREHKY